MSGPLTQLEERCAQALRGHLEAGDEVSLHEAYEFGREALADGIGVLDIALPLWRAALDARLGNGGGDERIAQRVEGFLLECLSPFEMAHRGAREANDALRGLDERREEEIRRIARELHDQAGQLLAAVHIALERIRPHLQAGGEVRLDMAEDLLRRADDELRRVAHELRPALLDDLGLVPALRALGEGVAQRSGIAVAVAGATDGRLPPAIEIALYRAVQEALNNVVRHACATRAAIDVRHTERELCCRVQDDGRGFDAQAILARPGRRGLGLDGIRERVARLGGAVEVTSRPRRGTELLIRLPLEVNRAHTRAHC